MIREDVGEILDIARTPTGIKVGARLARTGVYDYGTHREYRSPEEVFARSAMASFEGAPLTVGHPPEGVRAVDESVVGYVAHLRRDGDFVAGTLFVTDRGVALRIERGELREISMGYTVDLAPSERPDAQYEQRNIRGNHVAIGGTNWGRAGRDVRVKVDAIALARADMITRHARLARR